MLRPGRQRNHIAKMCIRDSIKARPYSLIRITNPRDHKPGDPQ